MKKLAIYGRARMRERECYKNYEIPKERFKELKHFCFQYWDFVKHANDTADGNDPTCDTAINRTEYGRVIRLIEMTAEEASRKHSKLILDYVTHNRSKCESNISSDASLETEIRLFYYLLDKNKGL